MKNRYTAVATSLRNEFNCWEVKNRSITNKSRSLPGWSKHLLHLRNRTIQEASRHQTDDIANGVHCCERLGITLDQLHETESTAHGQYEPNKKASEATNDSLLERQRGEYGAHLLLHLCELIRILSVVRRVRMSKSRKTLTLTVVPFLLLWLRRQECIRLLEIFRHWRVGVDTSDDLL